jgi:hypothetical protein
MRILFTLLNYEKHFVRSLKRFLIDCSENILVS